LIELAATVVTHGEVLSRVEAPGPELPAEAATKMPAEAAWRKAICTGSTRSLSLLEPTE
jgi:hypothetical protein